MGRKKPVNKDVAQKIFFKSPERFADICNGILYEGNEYIHAEDLDELDSDVSNTIQGKCGNEYLERRRDVVKRVRDGTIVTIVGIENQTNIHYAMPLRIISYDVLGYVDEAKQIAVKRRKTKREFGRILIRVWKRESTHTNYNDSSVLWGRTVGWTEKFSRDVG